MLTSLEIKNFRTFSHLVIERLGRVNLIVGKNNVGKTTLLEALRLYAGLKPEWAIGEMLIERDELPDWHPVEPGKVLDAVWSMFHRQRRRAGEINELSIGSRNETVDTLKVSFLRMEHPEQSQLSFDRGQGAVRRMDIDSLTNIPSQHTETGTVFRPARGMSAETLPWWWDSIALRPGEDRVVEFLQLLAPIERINFASPHRSSRHERIPEVRLKGEDKPVTLRSLGDGVVRIFEIAVALEATACLKGHEGTEDEGENGKVPRLLLIDEFENGIHHSLHAEVWRSLFRLAELHDLQIFATSHSYDCLRGFGEAIVSSNQNDGFVIRLEQVEGEERTGAVIVDREGVPIVVRESIEVR